MRIVAMTLLAASLTGMIAGAGSTVMSMPSIFQPSYDEVIGLCRVTDGDTIRCGNERIRLLGIDAPELPGHCRPGRNCAPGDPHASTASLTRAISAHMRVERVSEDRYGRTLAIVAGDRGDLSCWQLAHRQAEYKAKWDNGLRVARACPGVALSR